MPLEPRISWPGMAMQLRVHRSSRQPPASASRSNSRPHPPGIPVWWRTTSVERPVFKPGTRPFFESLPESTPDLPVTFRVTVITHDDGAAPADGGSAGGCDARSAPEGRCGAQQQADAPADRGSDGECDAGSAEDGRCGAWRQADAAALDVGALRAQLQKELVSAGVPGDTRRRGGESTRRGHVKAEVHVDTLHLSRTTCLSPQQLAGSGDARCGGPVHVPCAAAHLLTTPPPSGSAAMAGGTEPFHSGAADAAAHVRRVDRAMTAPHGAHHTAAPCPGTHQILVVVGNGRCGGAGHTCDRGVQEALSAWIGPARTSYAWLGGAGDTAGFRRAAGQIFGTVMHGLSASDLQPMHGAASGGTATEGNRGPGRAAGVETSPPQKLPLSAASELSAVFTMAVAEPEVGNLPEDIGMDVEVAWGPLVQRLEPLAHIRLESQARLYARARLVHTAASAPAPAAAPAAAAGDANATAAPAAQGVLVPPEALPFFVDSDAWALEYGRMVAGHAHPLSPDPHGIPESILHFVGYVPAQAERPMRVQCSRGACLGFKIAGWGGLTMLNSPDAHADVPMFLGTAIQQFRALLGLAPAGDWALSARTAGGGDRGRAEAGAAAVLSPESDGVALWEVDVLVRTRYVQLMHETGAAVTALLDLVSTLENLEIPVFVGSKIESAMNHAEQAVLAGKDGDYQFAMQQARAGRVDAEVALTHHTIASQHSYPFQHKIAVYLPLFAPLSLPIMAAVFVELKRRIRR